MSSVSKDPLYPVQQARFREMLKDLENQGVSQQEIAKRTGVTPAYLSDVKLARRPLTELFARRLAEEFGVDYPWLLGLAAMKGPLRAAGVGASDAARLWLPVFAHPVLGEPRTVANWDGSSVEIAGAAATSTLSAHQPYVLRFGADDRRGRLRKQDLLLISQVAQADAEIHVVQIRQALFLARFSKHSGWERVAPKREIASEPRRVGYCVGIVWGRLTTINTH